MNRGYFKSLTVRQKDKVMTLEDRYESGQVLVDELYDDVKKKFYYVDYTKQRYMEADDGTHYSDWKNFKG